MFHSGANLDGEYADAHSHSHSHKNDPPVQPPPRLRNSLLRTAFTATPASTASAYTASTPSTSSTVSTIQSAASSKRHSISSFSSLSSYSFSPSPPARSQTDRPDKHSPSNGLRPARALRANPHRASLGAVSPLTLNTEPVVRFHDPVVVDAPSSRALRRASTPAATPTPQTPQTPQIPTPAGLWRRLSNSQAAQKLQTPQNPLKSHNMSEDEASVSASEASYVSEHPPSSAASSRPGRRQRTPRKSTTYLFAHPAPKLSRKKPLLNRIRPTLLMQLQKISLDARPLPVIDVYPSSLLVGNVTAPRFNKRFPRLFGINGELGLHDTILVQSDNYSRATVGSESEGDDDSFEHRSLLAVFSPLRRGDHSEIVLQDGTVWMTTALPNGSFEFTCTDEHGSTTTARWVRRLSAKRTPATAHDDAHSIISTSDAECKFIFSVIDPQSRRHPILATLTKVTLSILDRYTTVSPSSGSRYPPTRAWTQSPTSHETDTSNDELSHDEDDEPLNGSKMAVSIVPSIKGRTTLPVDDKLKHFIAISSVWVSLQCGWGQTQAPGICHMANSTNSLNSTPVGSLRKNRDRQMSEPVTASETADSSKNDKNEKAGRRLSSRYRRSATFTSEATASTATTDRDGPKTPLFPRKASSTGAAYVQRQKQLQQLSDTSDSERPAANITAMTPKRRSRAFSRLSGEFSSMVSSKLHHSPSPPHAPATPEEPAAKPISRSNSMRLTAAPSDLKPSRNGRAVVSAYYTTQPSQSSFGGYAYAPASNIRGLEPVESLTESQSLAREQEQQRLFELHQQLHQQHQKQPPPLPHQELDRQGKWKKMSSWFKSRLSSH